MAAGLATLLHLFLLLHLSSSVPVLTPSNLDDQTPAGSSETSSLLLFKKSLTNSTALSSWQPTGTSPCDPGGTMSRWRGVICQEGSVSGLRLAGGGLSGRINIVALGRLKNLRVLRLSSNEFSGPIPSFGRRLSELRTMDLSRNQFAGPIPDDFFDGLTLLKKVWLDGNAFSGSIPSSLSKVSELEVLHLEDNKFTGTLPALALPALTSFNVSNNNLNGAIPDAYSKFDESSFMDNPALRRAQLENSNSSDIIPRVEGKKSNPAMIIIVFSVLFAVAAIVIWCAWCRRNRDKEPAGESQHLDYMEDEQSEVDHGSRRAGSSRKRGGKGSVRAGAPADGGGSGSDLVMVNEGKGAFGLPDLMKAAAEVMGDGGLGSVYKAVLASGAVVAVKRMRDVNRVGKEEFEEQMCRFGKLRHRNVLPPLAFHYRKDEKLMVSEYIPKGSLLYVLHGDRGMDHAALNWATRLKIAGGIANGLVFLHAELADADVPHGNLKSGNVLLAPDFEPLLVDYGFLLLVNPPKAPDVMLAFMSPEFVNHSRLSPKSDVYFFGVLLLELLTGKFPSQYLTNAKGGTDVVRWATSAVSEGRDAEILDPAVVSKAKAAVPAMKRLVGIALQCVEPDVERRPDVKEVAARIEEVVVAENERAATGPAAGGHTAYVKDSTGDRPRQRAADAGNRSALRKDDGTVFAIS